MIPYGKQTLDESDIQAVLEVFQENAFLTTGPYVDRFEQAVCDRIDVKYGIAVNSGTAALHCATYACGLGPGDEVLVTAMSFAASSNAVLYVGATPIFVDICPDTLNIDPKKIEEKITNKTKAIIFVDYAGGACDYHTIKKIADKHKLILIQDAAHSFGLQIQKCPARPHIGSFADLTTFSFHPVKNITTGEGGMIVTNNEEYANRMRSFRSHGIDSDYKHRKLHNYNMIDLGFNYRITDFQCALGLSQLKRLDQWLERRNQIAQKYDQAFTQLENYLVPVKNNLGSTYHIYVIKLKHENLKVDRDEFFQLLKDRGIGVNVHYKPIYLHPYYQQLNPDLYHAGVCPVSEDIYSRIITLPMYPTLTDSQVDQVITIVTDLALELSR